MKKVWVKHVIKEGARYHVISWRMDVGPVCSCANCEINRDLETRRAEAEKRRFRRRGPRWAA